MSDESKPKLPPLPATKSVLRPFKKSHTDRIPQPLRPPVVAPRSPARLEPSSLSELEAGASAPHLQPRLEHHRPVYKQIVNSGAVPSNGHPDKPADTILALKTSLDDLASEQDFSPDPSRKLRVDGLVPLLMPHQEVGMRFMVRRENATKSTRGGLLADDMGLGKTIQSIALILTNKPSGKHPRSTLVVTPLAVMEQWKDELNKMAPKLKVTTHYGSSRTKDSDMLADFDVVVTTYSVLTSEYRNDGALYDNEWFRIICDEAHVFRNPKTATYKAVTSLYSDGRRWALTGTPVHNTARDVLSLLQFIDGERFDKETVMVLERNDERLLKTLSPLMLRRTQRLLRRVLPPLSKQEHRLMHTDIADQEKESEIMQSTEPILVKLIRMRQAANGLLTLADKYKLPQPESKPERHATAKTPEAEDEMLANLLGGLKIDKSEPEVETYPGCENAKVLAIKDILTDDRQRKTVIFSSFVTMLELVRKMLDHEGFNSALYIGSTSNQGRKAILDRFKDPNGGVTVLLCSLGTAAVGLNLTSASQIIMVEPWWNPQISDQAIKRVHRIGQTQEVLCHELYMPNSIEERIVHIQNRKRKLSKTVLEEPEKLDRTESDYLVYGTPSPV